MSPGPRAWAGLGLLLRLVRGGSCAGPGLPPCHILSPEERLGPAIPDLEAALARDTGVAALEAGEAMFSVLPRGLEAAPRSPVRLLFLSLTNFD